MKVCRIDLMQIEEHFKENENIDRHLKKKIQVVTVMYYLE
jgi:hypothetical protein